MALPPSFSSFFLLLLNLQAQCFTAGLKYVGRRIYDIDTIIDIDTDRDIDIDIDINILADKRLNKRLTTTCWNAQCLMNLRP